MKQSYNEVTDLSVVDIKKFLFEICPYEYQYQLLKCFKGKDLKQFIIYHEEALLKSALEHLYKCQSYDDLERYLIRMNALFENEEYEKVKQELYEKIIHMKININHYCILRHLIDKKSLYLILDNQYNQYQDALEYAKICLIEEDHHQALKYLKQLDECTDEHVLNLLCHYSLYDYLTLKKHYRDKSKKYVLLTSH